MKILNHSQILTFLIASILSGFVSAQSSQAMYYLNFPQSVSSLGMGEQGVALLTNDDALVYNPANLVFTDHASLSYFAQPIYVFVDAGRIISLHSMFEIKNVGYFGVSYQNWDMGELYLTSAESPDPIGKFNAYERNFSVAYARKFSNEFSAGLQIRYALNRYGLSGSNELLFSGGLNYRPLGCNDKLNIGFSLTNFGSAVKYESIPPYSVEYQAKTYYESPPSKLNLAVNYLTIDNSYFSLPLNLGISKLFDDREDNGDGKSSFKTLFTDWKDFPRDATIHSGFAFNWKPLDLGGNVSFFQEFYFGNFTGGPKTNFINFFTHGFDVGLSFSDIKFSVGYAGRWYNNYITRFGTWSYPWETFQFKLSVDESYFFHTEKNPFKGSALEKIILSVGVGQSIRVGRYKDYPLGSSSGYSFVMSNKNSLKYFIEAAFYLNDNNALVTNFSYSSIPWEINFNSSDGRNSVYIGSKYENVYFSSSYRFHPMERFKPFFVEGGLGVQRTNPVINSNPKYYYNTFLLAAAGVNVKIYDQIVLSPRINYTLLLDRVSYTTNGMGGFNQFDFILNVGYEF